MKQTILVGRIKTDEQFDIMKCELCERTIEVLSKVVEEVPKRNKKVGLCFHCFLEVRGVDIKDPFENRTGGE